VKIAKILGFFAVSTVFFIVSYFSYTTLSGGFVWLFYLVAGLILAIIGTIIALSNRIR
jgi:hypothetical protein